MDTTKSIERMAQDNEQSLSKAIVNMSKSEKAQRAFATDEMSICGCGNENNLITLDLENTADQDVVIFLGTPLGISEEAAKIPTLWAGVPNPEKWNSVANLGNMEDNLGAGLEFFQLLNKRFLRRAVTVTSMTVVTESEAQRKESVQKVFVPFNSADSSLKTQRSKGVYTEFSETELIYEPTIFGEFAGVKYKVKGNVALTLNITLGSVERPTFKI